MRLVDTAAYARYTHDFDTPADVVEDAIDEVTVRLEETLGRPLALAQRTEQLPVYDAGLVYPKATPIIAATNATVRGDAVSGAAVDGGPFERSRTATVTYLGGFTPDTLPRSIAQDIALCALNLIRATPAATTVPVGATSVQVGDAMVQFGPAGAQAIAAYQWSPDTLRWKHRSL